MSAKFWFGISAAVIAFSLSSAAQVPAGAPAGSTGLCKDGTYATSTSKSGACRGHKGVQTWYAAPTSAKPATAQTPAPTSTAATHPAPTPAPAPAATPAPAAKSKSAAVAQQAPAAGGGPGMVWVNTSSKVYHCPGTTYYGKTKAGKYVTEAAAKAEGDHAEHGQPCSK